MSQSTANTSGDAEAPVHSSTGRGLFTRKERFFLRGLQPDGRPLERIYNRQRLVGKIDWTCYDFDSLGLRPPVACSIQPGEYLCRLLFGENFWCAFRGTYGFQFFIELLTGDQAGAVAIHQVWRTKRARDKQIRKTTLRWLRVLGLPEYILENRVAFIGGGVVATFVPGTGLYGLDSHIGYELSSLRVCKKPERLHRECLDRFCRSLD